MINLGHLRSWDFSSPSLTGPLDIAEKNHKESINCSFIKYKVQEEKSISVTVLKNILQSNKPLVIGLGLGL